VTAGQVSPAWPPGTGPAELTLPALLQWRAAELGDKPLLRIGPVTRSYQQVNDAAARMAAALADRGVSRGDRVAALCGNRIELMDLILGCGWLGATVVPLNTALRGTSLRQALDAVSPPFVMAEPRLAARLDEAAPTGLRACWVAGEVPGGWSPLWQPAPSPDGYAPRPAAAVSPADTLAILFTSGTTGTPLGVCSPHEQFAWWGINVSRTLRIAPDDVLYTCLPLFHTNALNAFAQAIVAGATYVLGTRFSASAFWDQLREADATVTYLLGAMTGILMTRPPAARDRAHRCRVALAPATPAHQQAAFRERFGIVLVDGFGSTETNLVIGAPPEEQRPGYLGRVITGFEALVVGADDQPVPDDTPGELVLRSHHRHAFATGYWQLPDRTAQAWRDGWFHTGDRVIRDPSGWFTFVDRIKDVIRRRGENISSRQVEEALAAHEDVVAAAAFAVPAEFAEDEVMVAVVRKPGSSAGAADLLRHCEQQLPYFAVPRYVDLVDELPLTETGKIAKSELRQRGITSTTWDRVAAGYRLRRDP
jgi:carnitine-CoA ligase